MNYYGCTSQGHAEFTCLSAFYTGPKRFRKLRAWCPECRARYRFPGPSTDSKLETVREVTMTKDEAVLVSDVLRNIGEDKIADEFHKDEE